MTVKCIVMKRFFLLTLCGLIILFAGCKKDAISNNFDTSFGKWVSFRNIHNNSYSYTSYGSSVFGYYAEMKFQVKNGIIISRDYKAGNYIPNTDSLVIATAWSENQATLNSHDGSGFDFFTLDQVYNKAQTVWLKADSKTNDIYFDVDTQGLLATAGYFPKGCQDDCFNGVHIKNISPL